MPPFSRYRAFTIGATSVTPYQTGDSSHGKVLHLQNQNVSDRLKRLLSVDQAVSTITLRLFWH